MQHHSGAGIAFRHSELCDGMHKPPIVGTRVIFSYGTAPKSGKPIAVQLQPLGDGAQHGVVQAFSGAAGRITPLHGGRGDVPFRLGSCVGFTDDRRPQSGDLVQYRIHAAAGADQRRPEATDVRPMGVVQRVVDEFHGYLRTHTDPTMDGAGAGAGAAAGSEATVAWHAESAGSTRPREWQNTAAGGKKLPARRAQPVFKPSSTQLVGIVVDGFSFLKAAPHGMDAAAAVAALEQGVAENVAERSSHDAFIPEGALVFFHPNPMDAEAKGIISEVELLETVRAMERVRRCGWTVVHTGFKKVAGRWMTSAEDVALSNQVAELVKPNKFPPLGAQHSRTTLDHIVVVTTDNDHVSTLRSEQGQALRWCASPAGAPRGRDLQRWGASVGGRFFEVSLAPHGATSPSARLRSPPPIQRVSPRANSRSPGHEGSVPPGMILVDDVLVAETALMPNAGLDRAREQPKRAGRSCAHGAKCTFASNCTFLHFRDEMERGAGPVGLVADARAPLTQSDALWCLDPCCTNSACRLAHRRLRVEGYGELPSNQLECTAGKQRLLDGTISTTKPCLAWAVDGKCQHGERCLKAHAVDCRVLAEAAGGGVGPAPPGMILVDDVLVAETALMPNAGLDRAREQPKRAGRSCAHGAKCTFASNCTFLHFRDEREAKGSRY